jgi:predicted metal-dependent hydrolase
MNALVVGDLSFALRPSEKRRTMQITVDRGGELFLAAPPATSPNQLRQFVMEKRLWVYTKLAEKNLLQWPRVQKEYVNGEGFLYLGKSYRLRLVAKQDVPLLLHQGRFFMHKAVIETGREHFIRWYSAHAQVWLENKVADYAARMEAKPNSVHVRELGHRWGSCGRNGRLNFHWLTILLPPHIAEYVVVHEIAHLHEPYHAPEFWRRVERAMPDYQSRKTWLAENGMTVEGI